MENASPFMAGEAVAACACAQSGGMGRKGCGRWGDASRSADGLALRRAATAPLGGETTQSSSAR